MLGVASATSMIAIGVASRLHRWYLRTLETSLVSRGSDLAPGETIDPSTARVLNSLRRKSAAAPPTVLSGSAHRDDDLVADIMQRHYLSDVVFGAAVGIVAGRTVTVGGHQFEIGPMAASGGAGVGLSLLPSK